LPNNCGLVNLELWSSLSAEDSPGTCDAWVEAASPYEEENREEDQFDTVL